MADPAPDLADRVELDWLEQTHEVLELQPRQVQKSQFPRSQDLPRLLERCRPDPAAIKLPAVVDARTSLSSTIDHRRSSRNFSPTGALSTRDCAQVLGWSAGVNASEHAYDIPSWPHRRNPSGGGLPSLDVYVAANRIEDHDAGLYRYDSVGHGLVPLQRGDLRPRLARCCPHFPWLLDAAAVLVLVADIRRQTWKYGEASYRFSQIDTGILVEALYLTATAEELAVCAFAGFDRQLLGDELRLDGPAEFVSLMVAIGPGR